MALGCRSDGSAGRTVVSEVRMVNGRFLKSTSSTSSVNKRAPHRSACRPLAALGCGTACTRCRTCVGLTDMPEQDMLARDAKDAPTAATRHAHRGFQRICPRCMFAAQNAQTAPLGGWPCQQQLLRPAGRACARIFSMRSGPVMPSGKPGKFSTSWVVMSWPPLEPPAE